MGRTIGRRRPWPRAVGAALVAALLAACAGEEAAPGAGESPRRDAAAAEVAGRQTEPLGDGYVVWESNRSGAWRLWIRDLDGAAPRQLTADEPGRIHCCPHVSPDGQRIAYLSLGPDQKAYPRPGGLGQLRLIGPDGSGAEVVAAAARSYFENRAVVWRGPQQLIHIDAERRTVLLDLGTGESRLLTTVAGPQSGYLIDPTLRWAASGLEGFMGYDAERQAVVPRTPFGGCQFYFSGDGRWGFWTAGAGGPIRAVDFVSGAVSTVMEKSDPRLPEGLGYLYFPMLSPDARLLAFAASPGEHSHFDADYEVFIAEVDPESLALLGSPIRWTDDPATDRFPDLYRAPLPLGRHAGEAPLEVEIVPPEGSWEWSWGDGASSSGARGIHLYELPGRFPIVASATGRRLRGEAVVAPARPPTPLRAAPADGGRELRIRFDEPVAAGSARLELGSGIGLTVEGVAEGGYVLVARPDAPLGAADTVRIAGVTDRARRPNELAPVELTVEAPHWPADRRGLQLLWETAAAPNLIFDPQLDAERSVVLEAHGTARLDHDFALAPSGGYFQAPDELANQLFWALKGRNTLSVEAIVAPDPTAPRVGTVLALEGDLPAFRLAQRGDKLFFGVRVGPRAPDAFRELLLFELPAGRKSHVAVSFSPGRLRAWLDGELRHDGDEIQTDMFHWRSGQLLFGAGRDGVRPWAGTLEGVAIYDRPFAPGEPAENHLRYRRGLAARPEVEQWRVVASLEGCAAAPDLRQIAPYREALVECRYRVVEPPAGEGLGERLRVARWAWMDGERLPVAAGGEGPQALLLERFEQNPQLEAVYLAAGEGGSGDGPLYYSIGSGSR